MSYQQLLFFYLLMRSGDRGSLFLLSKILTIGELTNLVLIWYCLLTTNGYSQPCLYYIQLYMHVMQYLENYRHLATLYCWLQIDIL